MTARKKNINQNSISREELAQREYARLVECYANANVDAVKLKINDKLIMKVAELWAFLESIKDLPTVLYDAKNPAVQKETAAGKVRVKYMAQYAAAMQKLNKEMLGTLVVEDDELDDFE